jgi:trigger factor
VAQAVGVQLPPPAPVTLFIKNGFENHTLSTLKNIGKDMQVTETLNQGLKRELQVVVPASELNSRLDEKLKSMQPQVQMKGFRPGKVPVSHIKKLYGKSAMAEIINDTLVKEVNKTIQEREERPTAEPDFQMTEDPQEAEKVLSGQQDLDVKVTYEVVPAIELKDFSTISIERPIAEVSEDDLQERLDDLASSYRPFTQKEGKTIKAEDGDKVIISYIGRIKGEAFEGGTGDDIELVLGSGQFIPGFEDGVIGMKKGETKTVKATFPEEYSVTKLAGQKAEFETTLNDVLSPGELELDDEFAKKFGMESFENLKDVLKQQMESQYGEMTRLKVKRQLLDSLDDMYDFELPQSLVRQEFDVIWKQVTDGMEQRGEKFGEEGQKSEEDVREEYQKIAERRVRLGLVLSEIGQKNEIQVKDEEVQSALIQQARQYPGQERQVIEFYQQNPQHMASLRAPIFEEKVIDYLIELANVTDKTVMKEELIKASEEDEDNI